MLMEKRIRKIPLPFIIIFSLFVVLISYISIHLYSLSKEEILSQSYQEIAAISKLKVKQITDWRRERIGEAEFIKRSLQFTQLTIAYLSNPSNKQSFVDLVKWIKPLKENHEYIDMILIKPDGSTYPLFSTEPEYLSSTDKEINNLVLATREIKLTDFHQEDDTGDVHIGIILPILSDSEKKKDIICTLMMRMDPNKNLFPLIQTWPSLSKTGETLLLKKDGKNVLFLNELRHKKNTTLKLKLPMDSQNLPAAKAARGFTGLFEGYDYRGVYVLSDINKIPDSPWFIVAKIDMDEILTPLKERTIWNTIFASVIILVTGLGIFIFLKQQQIQNLRKQIVLEQEKLALKKHYEYLILNANDIILLSDDYFEILEVNESALKAYGYTKEEFKKLTIVNIHSPESRRTIAYHKNLIDAQGGLIFETQHIRKNGEIFDVEVSSKLIEIKEIKYYQNIIRDITEKKQYEKKILRHNRVYSVLSNINQTIVRRRNREELFRECCRIAVEDGQFRLCWVGLVDENKKNVHVVSKCGYDDGYLDNINITFDENVTGLGPTGTAIKEGHHFVCNDIENDQRMKPWRENALKRNFFSSAAFPLMVFNKAIGAINFYSSEKDFFDEQEIKLLEELAMDISYALEFISEEESKKQVLKELRESEAQLSFALEGTNDGLWDVNIKTGGVYLSPRGCEILGYTSEEFPQIVKTWNEMVYPGDMLVTMEKLNDHLEGRAKIFMVEQRLKMKSGDWKWILTRGKIVAKDEKGNANRMIGTHTDISERKATENERLKLLKMIEKSINEIYTFDIQTFKFRYVNSGALNNLGYSIEQMKNITPVDIKPKFTKDKFVELVQPLIDGSKDRLIFQTVHQRANGSTYPVEVYLQIVEESGEQTFLAVINDITERKKSEEALKESETIFNYFLNYSPVYVFFKDENIRAIRLSKNFEQMLGRPMDEILGKTMDELFPSDLSKSMIEDDKKILQQGKLIVVDEELNGKYYTTIKFPIYIDNKPRYLAGFTIDITERKQAEKQLRERDELLFEMGKLAQVGGWEFDTVTLEGTWTEEVAKIHEVDPGDKTNVEFGSRFYVDHSRIKIDAAIREAIENGKPYDLELEMVTAKGNRKWVRTIGYPVFEGNKIVKVRGSFQDITKIKMVEEEIKKMNEELEKRVAERTKQLEISNKELEAFSYSISHDLRAPLRAINGYSNIVLENYKNKLDDEANELLNSITANTQKMSQLIDDLLEFSRLGRKELNKLPIDMNELVNTILTEQVDDLTSDRLDIKIENLPVAKADYSLIKQVIINLLSNAIKFSSTKEKSIIEIGGRAEHDENIYWIKDNGVGFSTKYSDKLFGVFQRLHKDSEFEGTGVGLAIVKRIINKHGGKVWAESIINEGSVFYFSLPEN